MGSRIVFSATLLFLSGWFCIAQAQTVEICNDGIDNDGNGLIDCADPFCDFAANIEKGCRCFDGIDNDGDGKIDPADTDCATYYGLSFVGEGSSCSITPPGGNPFSTIAAPQTSSQNTADTPSKISVGDMNNDGMPDIVITSKWNSTVQVVATTTIGGFDAGDIMGDFRTPGSNIFPLAGSKYVFEHESVIADINKDKIGELYVIASERGGSPNNKPVKFFLTGFRYAPNNLVPLFNAVFLGTDRPGSMGIADFDGDGKAEIYIRNRIYAAESGVLLADGGGNFDRTVNAGPVAANILGDSKLELICGPIIYTVPSLASRTLQVLTVAKDMNTLGVTYFPKGYNDTNEYGVDQASTTSTADFNGDGFLDVLMTGAINCSGNEAAPCGNPITTIFYWDVQNNTVRTYAPPDVVTPATGWAWGTGRINLGDATGDGKLDALFIAGNKLFCLTLDGSGNLTVVWIRTINDSLSGIVSLTVYDFDNNGKPEVVYRDAKELAVVDGLTGATKMWSAPCESHTYTEGPVVADVNGDGNTDICVPCYTNGAIGSATVQQQSLGQTRIYYSSTNAWLPTRKVWNQHPYYVTNINDNLTLPFPQIDPSLVFSNAPCPNGLPGPQRPLNLFMNQVPRLSASGCPEFPAPDLTFTGDDPANPGVDSDGDGVYTPAVVVTPPICGDISIKAFFNIINSGSLPISDVVPVSFFNGDPTVNPATAVRLHNTTITITNLQVGAKLVTPEITFNGPGTTFPLFIVLYNNGATLPITLTGPSTTECSISNNMYTVMVTPDPFTVTVEQVAPNVKCGPNVPPYTGEIRARIFKGATEVVDYSPYAFQWYDGVGTGTPHAGGTTYHLTNVIDGDYTVVVTNTQKGCASPPISGTVAISQINPVITLAVTSNQTICSPPNGGIDASIAGGNAGYTFEWYDVALTPLGISGPTATNLLAGNYVVVVSKNGCSTISAPATVNGPVIPDAQASIVANVVDCLTPGGGSVTGEAVIGGVVQNPAGYTFNWYFFDNGSSTRGSILPPANGTGPTRTGLAVGFYQLEIRDNVSQCVANQSPILEITDQTVLPTVLITEVTPQTSCDPLNPNGVLTAVATGAGLVSPSDYTFEWFKGDNTLPANLHASVSGVKGETANNVSGGGVFYTVKVTTANNCSATHKLIITENLNVPIVTLTPANNTVCDPLLGSSNFDGTINATVTFDGNPVVDFTNYQFIWHNGPLASDPVIPVADDKLPMITGLDGGIYTVTLERLDLACTSAPTTITVNESLVPPVLTKDETGSTNCIPGIEDGIAEVLTVDGIAVGSTGGYTYAWTGPVAPAFPVNVPTNNANTAKLIKLQGGPGYTYSILVTNTFTGCQTTEFVNVSDAKVLPVITLAATDNGICDPALTVPPKTFSGKITATVTNQIGALTDYTFAFGAGMNAGVTLANVYDQLNGGPTAYTATATHTVTGCVSSQVSIPVVNVQTLPLLTSSTTASTNCAVGLEDGVAEVLTVDGTGVGVATGYTYAWTGPVAPAFPVNVGTNASNTAQLIKVQGGAGYDYTVLVTNQGNGCQTSLPLNVSDAKVLPILTLTPQPNTICDATKAIGGVFDGQVDAAINNVPGGSTVNDYFFNWSVGTDGNGVDNLPGLDVGNYTVTALHNITGCQSIVYSAQVTSAKTLPTITMADVPSTNCLPGGAPDGAAQVTNVVPNGKTYDYRWFNGNSTAGVPGPVTLASALTTNDFINVQGGIVGVTPIQYTVEVTILETGCVSTSTVAVADDSDPPVLGLLTPTPNTLCTVAKNGEATITTLTYRAAPVLPANFGDFTFTWSGGTQGPGETITTAPAGVYSLTVQHNVSKCTSNPVSVTIVDDLFIPAIDIVDAEQTSCNPLAPNGSLSATIDETAIGGGPGVTANYTFTWVDNVTAAATNANAISNLKGDQTYSITAVRDATQCTRTQTIYLGETLTIPSVTVAVTDLTICAPPNGSLTATPLPASAYTFFWYNGADAVDENFVITNFDDNTSGAIYGGLIPGDYTVVVRDNVTQCISQQVISAVGDASPRVVPVAANTSIPTDCNLANGAVEGGVQLINPALTFTGSAATDELTTVGALGLALNAKVVINKNGALALPTPLEDDKAYFIKTIAGNVVTLSLTAGGAVIDLTANGDGTITDFVTAGHTYEWFTGVPTAQNPALGSINYFTNPPVYTGAALSNVSALTLITSGLYTIEVTNTATGCKNYLPHTLPFLGSHAVVKINKANSTLCPYVTGNGSIEIQIEDPPTAPPAIDQNDYGVRLIQGVIEIVPQFTPVPPINPFIVSNTLAPGSYIVEVEEQYSGSFCKIFQDVIIGADALPPVISLAALTISNTACDLTQFNGRIDINVTKDPDDLTVGTTYDIDMAADPNAAFPIVAQPAGNYPALNLGPGNYTFNVTASTGCSSSKAFEVLDNPVVSEFISSQVVAFDAEYCLPALEQSARIVVNQINVIGGGADIMDDYEFNWYSDASPFTASSGSDQLNVPAITFAVNDKVLLNLGGSFPTGLSPGSEYFVKTAAGNDITLSTTMGGPTVDITSNGAGIISPNRFSLVGDGSGTKGGEELSNVAPLPTAPVTTGSYWVIATKRTETAGGGTGGIGCTSAPFNVTISPSLVNPQIVLTPSGDTSCDPTFFEGSLEVDVATASGPGVGGVYDYAWAPTGGAGQPINSLANSGLNNVFNGVNDGTYTLTATNTTTGCASTLQTTLVRDSPPVFTMSAVPTNLTNCSPFNGRIDGVQVFVDAAPGLVNDFDYVWYRSVISVDSLVLDGLNPIVPIDNQLTLATFGGITLGTYFVKAVRSGGGTGVGCESVAIRRDILDERVTPSINFATVSSTSCDANFDGRITVTASTPGGPGAGANYNFVWTNDPDAAGAAYFASNSPTNNTASPFSTLNTDKIGPLSPILPGTYSIRVTNFVTQCFVDGAVDVLQSTIPMSVGSVTAIDEDLCSAPNGSGAVTAIAETPGPGNTANYVYTWDNDADISSPIVSLNPSVTLNGLAAGTYYVVAQKNAVINPVTPGVSGSGCETAPLPFIVLDKRVTPTISFATVASTSCDSNFDGQIIVTASTVSGPGAPANYNFVWTNDPDAAGAAYFASNSPTNNTASPFSTLNTDRIGAISPTIPGQYDIRVTNFITQCFVDGSVDVLKTTIPMSVGAVTSTDEDLCSAPNGSGTVTAIAETPGPGNPANYVYTWDNDADISSPILALSPLTTLNGLAAGTYYVKALRNPVLNPATPGVSGSGCETAPLPFIVLDKRVTPTIAFATVASTSCDSNFDGQIIVTASTASGPGAPANYNFVWTNDPDAAGAAYFASNSPTNNTASPFSTLNTDRIGAISPTIPGQYDIRVTNFITQCFVDGSVEVLKTTIPMSVGAVTSTDEDLCSAPNGSGTVTAIAETPGPGNTANYVYTWDNDADISSPILALSPLATLNGLAAGTYYVKALKNPVINPATPGVSGSGCETAPLPFIVLDKRVTPTISFATVASTSCDSNFDGQIIVTASTASGPGAPANYNFVWTSDPDAAGVAYFATNSPTNNTASPFSTLTTDKIGAISPTIPGQYDIRVTNFITQCFVDGSVNVLQSTIPMSISGIAATDVTLCLAPDGTGTVTAIAETPGPGNPANYLFTWDNDADMSSPILALSPLVTLNGLTAGTYHVQALRNPVLSPATPGVTGSGCQTPPQPFTVLDRRITPTISFSTVASTACDNNFDGQITVNASTSGGPGAGANYDFLWQSDPGGTVVVTDAFNAASPHITGGVDVIGPGAYTIRVVNAVTGCSTDAPTSLLSNPQPVDIVTVNKTDQLICYPDGSITVAALNTGGPASYTYEWYKDDPANPPLQDNLAAPITVGTLVPGIAATQYPTMGFGTYYVRATKNGGVGPGSGCTTPPFRVDVLDLHQDPKIVFTYTPNSSCDLVNPNGIVLADASEQGGANGDTYTFTWTLNAGALPPVTTRVDTNNSSQLDDAFEGTYLLQITNFSNTGCSFTSSLDVIKDLNVSLPNIINTSTVDPLDCLNSGSAQVTGISIGGGPLISGAALGTDFVYEWYANSFPGGLTAVTTPAINAIGPGDYFVVARDNSTQCKSGPTAVNILDDNIIYPVVAIDQTAQQISCIAGTGTAALLGSADGQSDANPNYTFDWFQNLTTAAPVFASTSTISNIVAGDYSLFVRNIGTNCTASAIYIVPNDAPLFQPEISVGGQPRTFCVGLDGSFLARVTNLSPLYPFPYNFTSDLYIGGSPNLSNPADFPNMAAVPGFTANFLQSGLTNGTYTVRVTDNNTGCVVTQSGEVEDDRTNPVITIVEDNPMINCDPAIANGQLSASADGGFVGGYTFDWFAGTSVPSPISGLIVSDNKLIGQRAGNFVVLVTNNTTGCFGDKSGTITDGTLIPPVPTPTVVFDRTNCVTPDGWVTVTVGGETLGYLFDWFNGTTAGTVADFSGVDYIDLDIGPYSVTATDIVTGCVSPPGTVEVLDKRIKPEIILSSTPSLCADTGRPASGSVTLVLTSTDVSVDNVIWTDVATNGNAGEGAQVFGLYPGLYHALVTTSKGCTNEGDVLVGTEVGPFNGVSDNGGDGLNDVFVIDCISNFPNNNVKIFNRSGILVYEGDHYNNAEVSFKGTGEKGLYLQGSRLPEGTYFYIIEKGDGSKPLSGYLELTR